MSGPIRHGTMDTPDRRVRSGALVEGFRVERVIATDPDLHTVVEADTPDGERVTLTLLSPAIAADRELRRSVLRRAQLRASIEHPHLAPLRDPCEGRKGLYLVSGVAGADTLADRLRDGPIEPAEAMRILGQVAGALETAAARGLLHRDLTPKAIVLRGGPPPDAVLTDFGVAMPQARGCELRSASEGADYRSPEEVRGEPLEPESNVYSLACILVECLSGAPPYPYELPLLTLHAHVVESPPRVSDRRPGLPPALDEVVARGMAKNPRDRYSSPAQLIRSAGKALGTEPAIPVVAAAKEDRKGRARAPAPRMLAPRARRTAVWIGLALLASAISGFATGSVDTSGQTQPPATVRSPAPADRMQQAAYVEGLSRAVERLRTRRAAARQRLRDARRPGGQAAAARALARAYRDARHALPAAPAAASGQGRLAQGLREAERAYREMAAAAGGQNHTAWRAAGREAVRREQALQDTLRAVRFS
ncbi:MAG TPA: serine/threonine-protein kinase [Thermoleophilaceae bacterium]